MGVIDLNGIKTQVKSILDAANVVGGSPIDLSQNLSTNAGRIKKILKINVEKIPIQPSFFPCVTMFYGNKNIELKDIARDMATGRRMAMIDLKLVGIVWNDDLNNIDLIDPADNDCENLMENVEHVLRSSPTLNGYVLQAAPTDVTYHSFEVAEGAHLRCGIMNLKLKVFY